MPWLGNCSHSGEGWCLDCVKEQRAELEKYKAERDEFECLLRDGNRLEILERYKKGLEYYADSNLFDGGAYARIVLGRR